MNPLPFALVLCQVLLAINAPLWIRNAWKLTSAPLGYSLLTVLVVGCAMLLVHKLYRWGNQ